MAQRLRLPKMALVPVAVSLVVGIITLVGMHLHARAQQARLQRDAQVRLNSIADAQASAVLSWREARLAEATELLEDVPLARRVQSLLADQGDQEARRDLASRLASLAARRHYLGAFLLDLQGAPLLGGAERSEPLGAPAQELAGEAMRSHQALMSDLYREGQTGEPRLDLAVPILNPDARQAAPLGAVVLRIDPRPALHDLLKAPSGSWNSVQGILLRQEKGGLRVLNQVPGAPEGALSILLPRDDGRLPAVLTVSQAGGVIEGRGLDGAPGLATLRMIPASTWCLVTQVREDEVRAPLVACAWPTLADGALVALALAAVLAECLVVSREAAARARERQEHQAEEASLRKRAEAAEGLAQNRAAEIARLEEQSQSLRGAGEKLRQERAIDLAILAMLPERVTVLDSDGRIVRFNWGCERLTGYSFDEVKGKPLWETLVHPRAKAAAQKCFARALAGKGPAQHKSTWSTRSGDKVTTRWTVNSLADQHGHKFVVYVQQPDGE